MTDIAALAFGIEAIAALRGSEHEHKRAAIARLLAMRDRLLDPSTERKRAERAERERAEMSIACGLLSDALDEARKERDHERTRANEWLTLLHDLRADVGKALTDPATTNDLEDVLARVDAALVRS